MVVPTRFLSALALLPLLACGDDGAMPADGSVDADTVDASVAQPSAGCGQPTVLTPGVTVVQSMTSGGRTRTWRVRAPASYDGSPRPVMVVLHGGGGTGEQIENSSGFDAIAEREHVIVVYPNGIAANESATNPITRAQTWNAGACCGPAASQAIDDVGFVGAVLDRVEAGACVDQRRVFATGMSNGGMMSYRLGCELASRIAAIAPVAGSLQVPACAPSRRVPLFAVHGSLDENVPYGGGTGCGTGMVTTRPIPDIVAEWAGRNQCSGAPSTVLAQGDGTCVASGTCAAETVLCTIAQGDHSWPGALTSGNGAGACGTMGGRPSTTFFASEAIWAFFARR